MSQFPPTTTVSATYAYELDLLKTYFQQKNIHTLVAQQPQKKDIINYYKWCRWAYRRYVSKAGHMHFAINDDFDAHAKRVIKELENKFDNQSEKGSNIRAVLEIGAGNGTNSRFLAKNYPKDCFFSSDLMNKGSRNPLKRLPNHSHKVADYHNLSLYKNDFFHAAFAVETLCHSTNQAQVLQQVYQKLQKGGLLLIFDGYTSKEKQAIQSHEQEALFLMERGMALEKLTHVEDFRNTIQQSDFELLTEEDLSEEVKSFAKYLNEKAHFFLTDSSLKYRTIRKYLPNEIAKNVATGLLTYPMLENNLVGYFLHILRK